MSDWSRFEFQGFESFDRRLQRFQSGIPFEIRLDHGPRSDRGAGFFEHVFGSFVVFIPPLPVAPVFFRNLPMLQRIGFPAPEPAKLFVLRNMKIKLYD